MVILPIRDRERVLPFLAVKGQCKIGGGGGREKLLEWEEPSGSGSHPSSQCRRPCYVFRIKPTRMAVYGGTSGRGEIKSCLMNVAIPSWRMGAALSFPLLNYTYFPLLRVITMAVLGEPEKPSGLLGIALAKESGIIDIKYVKKKWAQPQPEESEKLNLLLQQAL